MSKCDIEIRQIDTWNYGEEGWVWSDSIVLEHTQFEDNGDLEGQFVESYLNQTKCVNVLRQQLDVEVQDTDGFDIDDYFYGNPFQHLGDFLCHCDDTNTMTFGDNSDGEYFFYYAPSYPWERKENEPASISEVHERIIDAVLRICDLSRSQIDEMIENDLYDYGCG